MRGLQAGPRRRDLWNFWWWAWATPAGEYENTRHNAGFLAADRIAEKHHASIDRLKFKGTVGQCRLGGKGVLLLKPGTYMNLSGQSVTEAMRFL